MHLRQRICQVLGAQLHSKLTLSYCGHACGGEQHVFPVGAHECSASHLFVVLELHELVAPVASEKHLTRDAKRGAMPQSAL